MSLKVRIHTVEGFIREKKILREYVERQLVNYQLSLKNIDESIREDEARLAELQSGESEET